MDERIVVKNIMEDVVSVKIDGLIQAENACACEKCRADVMVLALNNLPPRYVSTVSGDVFSHFEMVTQQPQTDIVAAIVNAIKVVSDNPRH